MYSFLLISLAFFVVLFFSSPFKLRSLRKFINKPKQEKNQVKKWVELSVSDIWPALVTVGFSMFQMGAFWTVGPLLAEKLAMDGVMTATALISARTIPFLLGGFIMSFWGQMFSGLKAAQLSFLFSSVLLFGVYLTNNPVLIILLLSFSSLLSSFVIPLASGYLSNVVRSNSHEESHIQGLSDFYMNVGQVFGPILAGFFASQVGYQQALGLVGFFGIFVILSLANWNPNFGEHRNKLHLLKEGKLYSSRSRFDSV